MRTDTMEGKKGSSSSWLIGEVTKRLDTVPDLSLAKQRYERCRRGQVSLYFFFGH